MKLAIGCQEELIARRFERSSSFRIYQVVDGALVDVLNVPIEGHARGAMTGFLHGMHVDAVICDTLEGATRKLFDHAGIEVYPGIEGVADDAAKAIGRYSDTKRIDDQTL